MKPVLWLPSARPKSRKQQTAVAPATTTLRPRKSTVRMPYG